MFLLLSHVYAKPTNPGTYFSNVKVVGKIDNIKQEIIKAKLPITVEQAEKKAKISFKAYSPFGITSGNILRGTDISISGKKEGPFVPANTESIEKLGLQIGEDIPLIDVNIVRNGQIIFIVLEDKRRNNNAKKIEEAIVTVDAINSGATAQVGNPQVLRPEEFNFDTSKVIRLYETNPNSGIFMGYVVFRAENSLNNSDIIINKNSLIAVKYQENDTGIDEQDFISFDNQVAAEGRVFNTNTGQLLDGMNVSLIDAAQSTPADVFGQDGVSKFPSQFVTGSDTSDNNGNLVNVGEGEYIFPFVRPGQYRLRITNLPNSVIFPSSLSQADILGVPGIRTPIIEEGSYGEVFTVSSPRSIGIDLPIDTLSNVSIQKSADKNTASSGELITYSLFISNNERSAVGGMTIIDDSPREMRYVQGSLMVNKQPSDKIEINEATGRMIIKIPPLDKGEVAEIKYAMRIIPKVKNGLTLRNSAQAIGGGGLLSNIAYTDVRVIDDMLQSKGTIVGRVFFDDCQGNTKNKEGMPDIVGLENIRLFDQSGNFVLTDNKGKFSFPAVEAGTNVIQLDKITLPKGVKLSFCKDNTRHAGTDFSQFVDVVGGNVYKVNFTLSGDKEAYRPVEPIEKEVLPQVKLTPEEERRLLSQRPKTSPAFYYNNKWLDKQNDKIELVYPGNAYFPEGRSFDFGFKYPSHLTAKPYLNGKYVSELNKLAVDANKDDTIRITHYSGLDLKDDLNELLIEFYDENKKFVHKIFYQLAFNQKISKVIPQPKKHYLMANGLQNPKIIFKLLDEKDVLIEPGKSVRVDISDPYRFEFNQDEAQFSEAGKINNGTTSQKVVVQKNGELPVILQPTLESGKIIVKVFRTDSDYDEFDFWINSEKREWILVGLAQGTAGYNTVKGNMENAASNKIDQDIGTNGKVQFYTKGTIDKKWLVSASFDNTRRKKNRMDELFGQISLEDKYPVLGDYSQQGKDAASQYPLYLKIEKDDFFALFGDYNTDLGSSRVLPYSRSLSGFKTAYRYDNYSVQFFAAKDGQNFVRDDIPLSGTGETLKLSGLNLVRGSEKVYLEVRDINDTTRIISQTPLSRFIDYNLDYQDGRFNFTPAYRLVYNPVRELPILVVEFETYGDTAQSNTYGSRFAAEFFQKDLKIGANFIQDGGGIQTQGKGTTGASVDVNMKLTETTNLLMEYAVTEGELGTKVGDFGLLGNQAGAGDSQGAAQLIELSDRRENLVTRAFYRNEDNGFGMGTNSSFNVARQSYGIESVYNFTSNADNEKNTDTENNLWQDFKSGLSIYAKLNQNRDNAGRGSVSLAELGTKKQSAWYTAYSGIRHIEEDIGFGYDLGGGRQTFLSQSNLSQIISGGEVDVIDNRLSVFGGTELPFQDSVNTQSIYGNKNFLGFQSNPISLTNVTVTHEWIDLNKEEYQNTSASVVVTPSPGLDLAINGTNHLLPADKLSSITSSINKSIRLTDDIQMSLGYIHKEAIGGQEGIFSTMNDIPDYYLPFFLRDISVRSPVNFASTGYWEDYDLFGTGILKNGKGWRFSGSSEYRSAETENRFNVSSSLLGEVTNSLTAGISANYQVSKFKNGMTIEQFTQNLAQHSRNLGTNLYQYSDEETIAFLKDSKIAQIVGGTAYRPDGEDGPIILHRTLLEGRDNSLNDKYYKLVNNFGVQSNLTKDLELNGQYAHKFLKQRYENVDYNDFINIVGTQLRYDVAKNFDVLTQGSAYRSKATNTTDYSYGLGVGYVPDKNMRLRLGYNFKGFRDNDFNSFGYTAQGPFISFDMKFDQEDTSHRLKKLEDFMFGRSP